MRFVASSVTPLGAPIPWHIEIVRSYIHLASPDQAELERDYNGARNVAGGAEPSVPEDHTHQRTFRAARRAAWPVASLNK